MKTYEELLEAMSIKDMNKITGGTAAQRKIAQDRQRKREAKDKGFDPNKEVLKDKPKTSAITKAPESKPTAPERKPDLRKSQIGKWSQGIKNSPGKLAKRPETKPAEQEVKKVDVKVDEPTTKRRDDMEGKAGQQPGTSRGQGVIDNMKKKKKKKDGFLAGLRDEMKPDLSAKARNKLGRKLGKGIKSAPGKAVRGAVGAAKKLGSLAKQSQGSGYGTSTSGDLQGLSGRDKGLIS